MLFLGQRLQFEYETRVCIYSEYAAHFSNIIGAVYI